MVLGILENDLPDCSYMLEGGVWVFLCACKALKTVGQEAVMVDYTNLAGRGAVAEQKLASMKTHQNAWKEIVVQAPRVPEGGMDVETSTGTSQP